MTPHSDVATAAGSMVADIRYIREQNNTSHALFETNSGGALAPQDETTDRSSFGQLHGKLTNQPTNQSAN